MDISYHHVKGNALFKVNVEGQFDREASLKLCDTVAGELQSGSYRGVLIDLRDFECTVSGVDVYDVSSRLAQHFAWRRQRTALLLDQHHDRADRTRELSDLMELCAQNRGVPLRAFNDAEAAAAWLRGEDAAESDNLSAAPE